MLITCPLCRGTGARSLMRCERCLGEGEVASETEEWPSAPTVRQVLEFVTVMENPWKD